MTRSAYITISRQGLADALASSSAEYVTLAVTPRLVTMTDATGTARIIPSASNWPDEEETQTPYLELAQ